MVDIPGPVKRFAAKVKKKYPDARIFLFGSRATGNARPDSDWDFFIVSKYFSEDRWKHSVDVYRLVPHSIAADVLCYTPENFERQKHEPSLVNEAIRENALVEVTA